MNIEQVRNYTLSLYGVTEDQPFVHAVCVVLLMAYNGFLGHLTAFSVQAWFASDFLQSVLTRRLALVVGLDFTVF